MSGYNSKYKEDRRRKHPPPPAVIRTTTTATLHVPSSHSLLFGEDDDNDNKVNSNNKSFKSRKVRNVTTSSDYEELKKAYTFVPKEEAERSSGTTRTTKTSWQERMVKHYHSKLYKEYVLADLRNPKQIGLRWRTEHEVKIGKGSKTCGNKHCPSYDDSDSRNSSSDVSLLQLYYNSDEPTNEKDENKLLTNLPYGIGLDNYEINFSYVEHGIQKNELVKLCLCLRCSPLLFQNNNQKLPPVLAARQARQKQQKKIAAMKNVKETGNQQDTIIHNRSSDSCQDEDDNTINDDSSDDHTNKRKRRRQDRTTNDTLTSSHHKMKRKNKEKKKKRKKDKKRKRERESY